MDFSLGAQAEQFRLEVRQFLEAHMTEEIRREAWRTGTLHNWELHRALAQRGWIAPQWPVEMGGQGRTDFEMVAMNEELAAAGVPNDGRSTTMLVVETLRVVGTPDQQRDIIPRVLGGDILICLGYSEPDSGSDVAAAKTTAARSGSDWVINGQKMFTTLAHESAYCFLLARTDSTVAKHRGLTMFLVPMDAPGVTFTPIETLGGQLVNVTFFSDVTVPDSARVGDVNGGWDVMTVGLAVERTSPIGPGPLLDQVVGWASAQPSDGGSRRIDAPHVRSALANAAIEAEVARLLFYKSVWVGTRGAPPVVEGSMSKLFGSEAYNRVLADIIDSIGPEAIVSSPPNGTSVGGELEHAFRYAPFYTIAGGVSEIQREIIATRGLGLPRSR
ncbi:MAG: acyl-CoA dehydrogenase family protein [Ilumatobacteraceae bacterium]